MVGITSSSDGTTTNLSSIVQIDNEEGLTPVVAILELPEIIAKKKDSGKTDGKTKDAENEQITEKYENEYDYVNEIEEKETEGQRLNITTTPATIVVTNNITPSPTEIIHLEEIKIQKSDSERRNEKKRGGRAKHCSTGQD